MAPIKYQMLEDFISRCYVALRYCGHDVTDVEVFKARRKRGVTRSIRRELKRRNAYVDSRQVGFNQLLGQGLRSR